MKKLFSILLILLFSLLFTVFASADVMWGPGMAVILAIHYWYITLLVIALIIVTIILIKRLKKKGD